MGSLVPRGGNSVSQAVNSILKALSGLKLPPKVLVDLVLDKVVEIFVNQIFSESEKTPQQLIDASIFSGEGSVLVEIPKETLAIRIVITDFQGFRLKKFVNTAQSPTSDQGYTQFDLPNLFYFGEVFSAGQIFTVNEDQQISELPGGLIKIGNLEAQENLVILPKIGGFPTSKVLIYALPSVAFEVFTVKLESTGI